MNGADAGEVGEAMNGQGNAARTIAFIDPENAVGSRYVREGDTARVIRAIECEFGPFAAIVIGATYGINAFNAKLDAPGALTVLRYGDNGADRALQAQMQDPTTWGRYDRMVLVSSDGGFTAAVSDDAAHGMHTIVVGGASQISKTLRLAAHEVRNLDFGLNYREVA